MAGDNLAPGTQQVIRSWHLTYHGGSLKAVLWIARSFVSCYAELEHPLGPNFGKTYFALSGETVVRTTSDLLLWLTSKHGVVQRVTWGPAFDAFLFKNTNCCVEAATRPLQRGIHSELRDPGNRSRAPLSLGRLPVGSVHVRGIDLDGVLVRFAPFLLPDPVPHSAP